VPEKRGVGGLAVLAEADVGGQRVGQRHVLDAGAVGRDRGDAALHERADADPALAVDRQRVEQRVAARVGQQLAAVGAERLVPWMTPGPVTSQPQTRPVWVSAV
jgi:hypothetical protein